MALQPRLARPRFTSALFAVFPGPLLAQDGRVTSVSRASFARVTAALEQAITDQKMALVCHANAQKGAAARVVSIRGNQVFMVFRNDYAVRLLAADPAAGFEPPIRIYAYENADGTATVTYAPPSAVFGRYAAGTARGVWISEDGGRGWTRPVAGLDLQTAGIIALPGNPGRLPAATREGVFEGTDDAQDWHRLVRSPSFWGQAAVFAAMSARPETLLAASHEGVMVRHARRDEPWVPFSRTAD